VKCKLLVLSPLFSMAILFDMLAVSPFVIQRLWNRFRKTGQYVRRAGQGRNRKTIQNQDRFLVLFSLRKRTATARDLLNDLRRAHGTEISDQTVRNRLKEANLKPRRPVRAPLLMQHHKAARMRFALDHRDWQLRHWTPVLFTDEPRFRLTRCDGRVRVYWVPQNSRNNSMRQCQHIFKNN
jgi:transposase